jgi:hypothetical protein
MAVPLEQPIAVVALHDTEPARAPTRRAYTTERGSRYLWADSVPWSWH